MLSCPTPVRYDSISARVAVVGAPHHADDGEGKRHVQRCYNDERLLVAIGLDLDVLRDKRQILQSDERHEGGVLQELDRLISERRNRHPQELRKQDVEERLHAAETGRERRLALLVGDAAEAGRRDVGDEGALVDDEPEQCGRKGVEAQNEIQEEKFHDQRDLAHDLHVGHASSMRGVLWEVLAVPDIRVQADRLVRHLLDDAAEAPAALEGV